MKRGIRGGLIDFLSESEMECIHQAALSLLMEPGVLSESDLILDLFQKGGAHVDREARTIHVPPYMVEAALETAPGSFVVHGRQPEMDLLAEAGRVYYGLGGTSEPYIWDYETGKPRNPGVADMVSVTRVGQALVNVDFIMALCSARDVPQEVSFFHEYEAIFRNTTKPVVVSSLGQRMTAGFLEMAVAASGGEVAFRQRPWVIVYVTPIAPLQVSRLNEGMLEAARYNLPIQYSPAPMMGATGPVSVVGTLVQSTAEELFGLVMSQLLKPGLPFIYAPHTPVMDMRTTQCTYASPEQALGRAMVAQFGRYYDLPTFNTGAGVEAKLPDAAAAAEATLGMLLNAMAGMTLTQCMGTLASGLYGSMEMLVICNEIAHMIKRVMIEVSVEDEAERAVQVIRQVGHHGSFLDHGDTLQRFKQELYQPLLFRRQTIAQWIEAGAVPVVNTAHERVMEILSTVSDVTLPEGAGEALASVMSDLVREFQGAHN